MCDSGKVLWQKDGWRSDKKGVRATFSIPIDGNCKISLTIQAHHFCSNIVPRGSSVVRLRIVHADYLDSTLSHSSIYSDWASICSEKANLF